MASGRCQLGTYSGTAVRSLPWRGQGQPDENHEASPAPVPGPAHPAQLWPWLWAGLRENRGAFPSLSSGPVCACLLLLQDLGTLHSAFKRLQELTPTHSNPSTWVSYSGLHTERFLCRWASYIFQLAMGRGF